MDVQMLRGFRGRIVSQVGLLDVFVAQASEAMLLTSTLALFITHVHLAAYRGMPPMDGAVRSTGTGPMGVVSDQWKAIR